jgi:hypothetical protein
MWCKKKLPSEFDIKDIGLLHYILGLGAWQGPREVFLGQRKYTLEISREILDA